MIEIGDKLRRSEGAIKLLLFRARQALKFCLNGKLRSTSHRHLSLNDTQGQDFKNEDFNCDDLPHDLVRMTDSELIQLLETKLPQELTAAEVALVRARLQSSPGIQKALRDRLLIDESLNLVLGEIHLEPEVILARKSSTGGSSIPRWIPWASRFFWSRRLVGD